MVEKSGVYRGRLAPSPTGYLHLGHARTFWNAQTRAQAAGGALLLRNDDLDRSRCRPEFVAAMLEDLRWFGFRWDEGPDVSGPFGPYTQSERLPLYRDIFAQLLACGAIYPCTCSRKDVAAATTAPHETADEPLYPGTCRPENLSAEKRTAHDQFRRLGLAAAVNWRFHVPDGETLTFTDGHFGAQTATCGQNFSDFLAWRKDDLPSYQLACTVDDHAMEITEVVRGADLLLSTFRQLLLYRALGWTAPNFFHCPLVTDDQGVRLAKRHDALSLRALRHQGKSPEEIRCSWK